MEQENTQILVIDDDPVFRNILRSTLKNEFQVTTVETPSSAFKKLKSRKFQIVICDFRLPEMNGLKVLQKIKEEHHEIEVIMISSEGDMDTVIEALRIGAADFFKKPFSSADIILAIERTKRIHKISTDLDSTKRKNSILKKNYNTDIDQQIIGNSPEIRNINQLTGMVSQTPDTSVLILGESGTGKELIARAIHNQSDRKNELFGAVNMSAIPENLFESEFFGHKKGSFTGALADKAGWFESANKGTLFLDEIGEMSMALQVKLLRVLEERKYTKVGTHIAHNFDVRVVAATNKTVEELTSGKDFRLDLFHRLGTFIIHLPPLRERKEDIPELSGFFLNKISGKMNKTILHIHPDVFTLLERYSFPGNIRELKNLIERAVIVCQGDELLPQHFSSIHNLGPSAEKNDNIPNLQTFDLKEIEKQTIIRALNKVNFNKAEAARLLNLEWNALYRRIRKYKIEFE